MKRRIALGFAAGATGAFLLVVIFYLMQTARLSGPPGFVGNYRAVFGANPNLEHFLGAILFAVSGGIWGAIYAAFVKRPTVASGAAFGFVPTLWLWLVVAPFTGKPFFNGFSAPGILLPILFNVVIWGSFVGWYCRRRWL
jgi:hypothetical protein